MEVIISGREARALVVDATSMHSRHRRNVSRPRERRSPPREEELMRRALMILIASTALATATAASQQPGARSTIHRLEELTAAQIAALDRARTLFILPVGMLEQHGPHLPVGADTLGVVYEA